MEELKKVNCEEWKNKEPGSEYSTPFAIQYSNQIDEALQNCDDILSEIGCGVNYDSKQSKMKTLLTDAACLVNYVYSIVADIKFEIDEPLKLNFSKKATETISRIKAEDIETSYNPDGIQGTVNIGGIIESTRPMPLKKLKFEDFMSEDRIGGPAREKFAKLFKAQYDEAIKLGGINKSTSYDEYIKKLTKDGEFDHVVDSPYESFLSNLLDVTIIKPLIEAYTGYDMITGEDLTYSGRFLKVGMALIDIMTIGQATTGLEGLRGVTATMKAVGVNAVTNATAMGANAIAEDLNLPAGLRILLSLGAGYAVSKVAGKYILTNSEGKVIGEYKVISEADRLKLSKWKYPPSDELYLENKKVYDNPKYFNQETGDVIYPGTGGDPNIDGFVNGEFTDESLTKGKIIDRYGDNASGQYFSPDGSSFESRALPPFMKDKPYERYEILRDLKCKVGDIAPWFDKKGMGTQFFTDYKIIDIDGNYVDATVENLINNGYIKKLN